METLQITYANFCKGHDYYEDSTIESIKARIVEDGGNPEIIEDEISLQVDGIFPFDVALEVLKG